MNDELRQMLQPLFDFSLAGFILSAIGFVIWCVDFYIQSYATFKGAIG